MAMNTKQTMLLTFAKRYWLTLTGAVVITSFVVISVFHLGTETVGSLVETVMRSKGDKFADLLTSEEGNLNAFLTSISRDPEAEVQIRNVAA